MKEIGTHAGNRLADWKKHREVGQEYSPTKEHGHKLYERTVESLANDKRRERNLDIERGNSKAVQPFLKKVKNLWKTDNDEVALERAQKISDTISSNIDSKGNIDIENAWENIKSLGRQYRDRKTTEGEKIYIKEAQDALKQVLKDHSAINPKFGEKLEDANAFHVYRKTNNVIKDWFESPGKIRSKFKNSPEIPQALNALESVGRAAFNRPARNYYKKLGEAILDDRKGDAQRYAIAFNDAWNKQQLDKENDEFREIPFESRDEFTEVA